MSKSRSRLLVGFSLSLLFLLATPTIVKADDPTAEEIIAKHLESIGTKEKREAVKNRIAAGTSRFSSKLPARKTTGKVVIVSDPNNLFFVSSFASQEYPFEKIGYFNGKVSLPFVTAGTKSPLGAFIADHNKVLGGGVFAGAISSMWNFSNPSGKKEKFDSAGAKKIDGRKTYALNYYPGGGSTEFTVKLFFDAETFRHVRTEYTHTVAAKEASFGVLGQQFGVKIALAEIFGDFKVVDGLTLPHTYQIQYLTDSNSGTYEYNWDFAIQKYLFNQNLAADFFTFDEQK